MCSVVTAVYVQCCHGYCFSKSDLLAAQSINEELDQLDKQRTKLDELWIKTQKYLNQTLQFQQKQQQQAHTSAMSPSEWLGSVAEPFIANMPIGTSSSEADDVIAKLDSYAKQAEVCECACVCVCMCMWYGLLCVCRVRVCGMCVV